jgi:hypothetical protein
MTTRHMFDEICGRCGLSFGAHRADHRALNQCPAHEGRMDWPDVNVGTFVPTGEYRQVPKGTPSKLELQGKPQ